VVLDLGGDEDGRDGTGGGGAALGSWMGLGALICGRRDDRLRRVRLLTSIVVVEALKKEMMMFSSCSPVDVLLYSLSWRFGSTQNSKAKKELEARKKLVDL
jgi:hypothetical protein